MPRTAPVLALSEAGTCKSPAAVQQRFGGWRLGGGGRGEVRGWDDDDESDDEDGKVAETWAMGGARRHGRFAPMTSWRGGR